MDVRILLLSLALVFALSAPASARTWCIQEDGSGDAPTIQAGIDSAASEIPFWEGLTVTGPLARAIEWPHSFTLWPNKAIVYNNKLLREGETAIFTYDGPSGTLFMNGDTWRIYKPSLPEPRSPREAWARQFHQRFAAEGDGPFEDRVNRVLATMEQDILAPDVEPIIGDGRVTVRFLGHENVEWVLALEPLLDYQDPETAAKKTVAVVESLMTGTTPQVIINYPGRYYIKGGDIGNDVLALLQRAETGSLAEDDRSLAERLHILEAVEAISRRAMK